jgi:hypothetical protein
MKNENIKIQGPKFWVVKCCGSCVYMKQDYEGDCYCHYPNKKNYITNPELVESYYMCDNHECEVNAVRDNLRLVGPRSPNRIRK